MESQEFGPLVQNSPVSWTQQASGGLKISQTLFAWMQGECHTLHMTEGTKINFRTKDNKNLRRSAACLVSELPITEWWAPPLKSLWIWTESVNPYLWRPWDPKTTLLAKYFDKRIALKCVNHRVWVAALPCEAPPIPHPCLHPLLGISSHCKWGKTGLASWKPPEAQPCPSEAVPITTLTRKINLKTKGILTLQWEI
jgi:hypothetical protein